MILIHFLACSSSTTDLELPLVDLSSWSFIDLEEDPLASHQPDVVECDISAFRMELQQLEIRTDYCNYAAISFATQAPIKAGDRLELIVLHTGLWALESAEAHIHFMLDGNVFWEDYPPIPSQSDFFFHEAIVDEDFSVGTKLQFHLHNHGVNDWKIGYFRKAI